jgi:hypothetical protein
MEKVVGDYDDGHVIFVPELPDQLDGAFLLVYSQVIGRLIQNYYFLAPINRPSNSNRLPLTSGKIIHLGVQILDLDLKLVQQVFTFPLHILAIKKTEPVSQQVIL